MKELFRRIVSFFTYVLEMWSFEYQHTKSLIKSKYNLSNFGTRDVYSVIAFLLLMLFLIPEITIFFLLGILAAIISGFFILIFEGSFFIFTLIIGALIAVGYTKSLVVSIFFYVAFFVVSIFMLSLTLTKKE